MTQWTSSALARPKRATSATSSLRYKIVPRCTLSFFLSFTAHPPSNAEKHISCNLTQTTNLEPPNSQVNNNQNQSTRNYTAKNINSGEDGRQRVRRPGRGARRRRKARRAYRRGRSRRKGRPRKREGQGTRRSGGRCWEGWYVAGDTNLKSVIPASAAQGREPRDFPRRGGVRETR